MDTVAWIALAAGGLVALATLAYLLSLHRQEGGGGLEIDALPEDLKRRLPVSLHPVIDPTLCMGSGACVAACPEGKILRLHEGRSHLVHPEACVGHGACARECPVGAISLVFGTSERGVDIPHVSPTFETNIKGIFIAGELGGMGLIRNAVSQGVQAIDQIARRSRGGGEGLLDLIIVGAGPAGLAAGLTAKERGLRFALIDQEAEIGGTIAHYPRNKLVLTGPLEIPGFGRIKARELRKEELIEIWRQVVEPAALPLRLGERLVSLAREGDRITVETDRGTLAARHVLLAVGRRGTPRRLGVPGEELAKVAYSLREPEIWSGQRVLVVGGGDSALEAALQLSEVEGVEVTLSYRGEAFFRAKPKNQARFQEASERGRVRVLLGSTLRAIEPGAVTLALAGEGDGEPLSLANDQVFIFAGGVLPTGLLSGAGISMERKFGSR